MNLKKVLSQALHDFETKRRPQEHIKAIID